MSDILKILTLSAGMHCEMIKDLPKYRTKFNQDGGLYRVTAIYSDLSGVMINFASVNNREVRGSMPVDTFLYNFEPAQPDLGAAEVD